MRPGQRIKARVTQTAEAGFKITRHEQFPFEGVPAGFQLTKGRYVLAYEGDLRGEGILEELKVHFTDTHAAMTGLQQVTGRLGDYSGTFVLNYTAHFRKGLLTARQIVVPGSATGGLKSLRGEMFYHSKPAEKTAVTFNYYFA